MYTSAETGAIGPQAAPAPASVHAARIENLTHRVMTFAYEVEVHQVDRGPGREKIQENRQELAEFRDEVLRRCEGEAGRYHGRYEKGQKTLRERRAAGCDGIHHTQESQGRPVIVERSDRHEAKKRA